VSLTAVLFGVDYTTIATGGRRCYCCQENRSIPKKKSPSQRKHPRRTTENSRKKPQETTENQKEKYPRKLLNSKKTIQNARL
jgi:hypothetical protein